MIQRGKPTVLLTSTNFVETAKTLAKAAGLSQLPYIVFPADVDNLPEKEILALAEERSEEIFAKLIDPFPHEETTLQGEVAHATAQRV